mmetsp:Transcript_43426/g.120744  ORF Transcript_43426/g.120744 Transcript_43426/m.120744 type:complete len:340 (+) Transcript_43426:171-1190(+)
MAKPAPQGQRKRSCGAVLAPEFPPPGHHASLGLCRPPHQERRHRQDRGALALHEDCGASGRAGAPPPVRRQAPPLQRAAAPPEELLAPRRRRGVHHDAAGPALTVPEVHLDLVAGREAAAQLPRAHAGRRGVTVLHLDDVAVLRRVGGPQPVDSCGLPRAVQHFHCLARLQRQADLVQANIIPHLAAGQAEVVVRHHGAAPVARLQHPRKRLRVLDTSRNPHRPSAGEVLDLGAPGICELQLACADLAAAPGAADAVDLRCRVVGVTVWRSADGPIAGGWVLVAVPACAAKLRCTAGPDNRRLPRRYRGIGRLAAEPEPLVHELLVEAPAHEPFLATAS